MYSIASDAQVLPMAGNAKTQQCAKHHLNTVEIYKNTHP